MRLEGISIGWFRPSVDLILNGQHVGTVRSHWIGEGMDLDLHGHQVRFEKASWLRSQFVMSDAEGFELGSAQRRGVFSGSWDMHLKSGEGILQRAGWMTAGFELKQGDDITARINLAGWFTRNWELVADDTLAPEDAILIGLVYMTIRHREAQQAAAG